MTLPRRVTVALACATGLLLLGACSKDVDTLPLETTGTPSDQAPPSVTPGTRHTADALVDALPSAAAERHGLAVFESCTDFDRPGECLEQQPGTVVVNLTDGMNQGLLLTVARTYRPAEFVARGAVCPDGAIDEAPQELDSGAQIPGRQGTGQRTEWEHAGWAGWVCEADYTQVDSDGTTEDSYSLTLLLATNGHHLLSVRTAADVDVEAWAREYVDRLEG